MVFSLFEKYKPEQKVQLKNPTKVVIGSGLLRLVYEILPRTVLCKYSYFL